MIEIAAQAWALAGNGVGGDPCAEEVENVRIYCGPSGSRSGVDPGWLDLGAGAGHSGWSVPCYASRSWLPAILEISM